MIFSVEDVDEEMTFEDDVVNPETGAVRKERRLRIESLVDQIVNLILIREKREKKYFGTIVLAEGLAELFPEKYIRAIPKDEHGNISIGKIDIGKEIARLVAGGVPAPHRQGEEGDRAADRLRVALRPSARLRRDARQPARDRRLPRPGRGESRRTHGQHERPARSRLRPVRASSSTRRR